MRILLAMLGATVVSITPAAAMFCSEPSAPSCARQFGEFYDEYEFNDCRQKMVRYQRDVEDYRQCLINASDEVLQEYNQTVERFNRRVRGY